MRHRFITVYRTGRVIAPSRALEEQEAVLYARIVLASPTQAPTGTPATYGEDAEIRGRQTGSGWGRSGGNVRRRDGVECLAIGE